ncbi:MAG: potassium channel family protein [Planctomycetota bacterium]|jgi:trk system potassium uptake protein TrkA
MYIVIAGAGIVGGELARRLLENRHDVVVVDQDKESCDKLYAGTGAVVINGSAARIEILQEAGIAKADVLVAATATDADNLVCALLGKSLGVPRIIARMRDTAYERAFQLAGVESLVRVTDLMVNQMVMEVEQPELRSVTAIGGGRADIFSVKVPPGAPAAGKSVKDLTASSDFPAECVFVAVYNRATGEFSIPRGSQVIGEGDEIFVIASAEDVKRAADFLRGGAPAPRI